ncbi:MAG: prepilin-type N-terminal cleavage/methylation domain-containing protein [Verrucomicrobiales bacterium]|nr:prepilin-type N-terminal cleavage/methylation domain-containing protein [Verrucomicrobiales bacterium]
MKIERPTTGHDGVRPMGTEGYEAHEATRRLGPSFPSFPSKAFTLLEVMIAMAIFFMAVFAILGLVAQNLRIARNLSLGEIDVSTVAVELTLQTLTNREMSEGFVSGDFGETYPGASWTASLYLVSSNAGGLRTRSSGGGLYQADITINWPQNNLLKEKKASLLLYRPNLGGGPGR